MNLFYNTFQNPKHRMTVFAWLALAFLAILAGFISATRPLYAGLLGIGSVVALGGLLFVILAVHRPNVVLFVYLALLPWHFLTYKVIAAYVSENIASVFATWKDLLLLFGFGVCLIRGRVFRPTWLDFVIVAFVGYLLILLLLDFNMVTVRAFGNHTRYLLIYLLVRWLKPDLQTQRHVIYLMIGMASLIAVSGIGIWFAMRPSQFLFMLGNAPHEMSSAYSGGFPRALSILVSANSLGRTMSFLLVGLLIWYSKSSPPQVRLGQICLMIVAIVTLLLSLSRTSWAGTTLALATVAFLNRRVRWSVILLGISAVFVLIPVLTFTLPLVDIKEIAVVQRFTAVFDSSDGSSAVRYNKFPEQVKLISDNPLGVGMGRASRSGLDSEYETHYSESSYFQLGIETGYIGIGLLIAMVILVPSTLWRKSRKVSGPKKKICLWAMTSVTSLYVSAAGIPALAGGFVAAAYIWTLVGLAMNYKPDL